VPPWADGPGVVFIARTADELSVVCASARVPADVQAEHGWRALELHGPFLFTQSGVLASVLKPLAEAEIPIFAVSTFDTDYVLVPERHLEATVGVLRTAGHTVN